MLAAGAYRAHKIRACPGGGTFNEIIYRSDLISGSEQSEWRIFVWFMGDGDEETPCWRTVVVEVNSVSACSPGYERSTLFGVYSHDGQHHAICESIPGTVEVVEVV